MRWRSQGGQRGIARLPHSIDAMYESPAQYGGPNVYGIDMYEGAGMWRVPPVVYVKSPAGNRVESGSRFFLHTSRYTGHIVPVRFSFEISCVYFPQTYDEATPHPSPVTIEGPTASTMRGTWYIDYLTFNTSGTRLETMDGSSYTSRGGGLVFLRMLIKTIDVPGDDYIRDYSDINARIYAELYDEALKWFPFQETIFQIEPYFTGGTTGGQYRAPGWATMEGAGEDPIFSVWEHGATRFSSCWWGDDGTYVTPGVYDKAPSTVVNVRGFSVTEEEATDDMPAGWYYNVPPDIRWAQHYTATKRWYIPQYPQIADFTYFYLCRGPSDWSLENIPDPGRMIQNFGPSNAYDKSGKIRGKRWDFVHNVNAAMYRYLNEEGRLGVWQPSIMA